jgi:hypothetical protein
MAQTAAKLRLVEAPSTGYARKAWISHVIETAPDEVGGTELAVLKELADLVDDATGWAEASYEKLAHRTRFAVKTVRNAVKKLKALDLIEPELIRGEGRDRLRYHFPNMHAFLTERKVRLNGGRSDHGTSDYDTRPKPTLVSEGENPPPLKELDSKPCAQAREGLSLEGVKRRLAGLVPPLLATALEACEVRVGGGMLRVWEPDVSNGTVRRSERLLQMAADRLGLGPLVVERWPRAARAGA